LRARRQLRPWKINLLRLIWIERRLSNLGGLAWKARIPGLTRDRRLALHRLPGKLRIRTLLRILRLRILALRILALRILPLRILGLLIRVILGYRLFRAGARNAIARPACSHIQAGTDGLSVGIHGGFG